MVFKINVYIFYLFQCFILGAHDGRGPQQVLVDSSLANTSLNEDNVDNAISDDNIHPSDKDEIYNLCKNSCMFAKVNKVNNHGLQNENTENTDLPDDTPEGFLGVERKHERVKKVFISGIADDAKPNQVLTYLKQRGVVLTYMSIFSSKRKRTPSAKLNTHSIIFKISCGKSDFWPKYVSCRPWQSNPEKANLTNPVGAHSVKYATDVEWIKEYQFELPIHGKQTKAECT